MYKLIPYQRNNWSLLDDLASLQDDVNSVFGSRLPRRTGRGQRASYPSVNVRSSEDELAVDAELPGVDVKDIDISIEGDVLTLRGKVKETADKEGDTWHCRERRTGEFVRTLDLPFKADVEGVKATYKDGVLRIAVPRVKSDKPHKVAIKVS